MRDWATGGDLPDTITRAGGGVVWGRDSSFFLYVEKDDNHRPLKVFRHRLGTPQTDDDDNGGNTLAVAVRSTQRAPQPPEAP